jgi:hypothetical protein
MSDESNIQENTKPPADVLVYRMVGDMAPLFGAMATATLEFEPITKDRHVKIQTKDRGSYEFDYATLEEVLRCTTPALARQGLKLFHFLCDAADGAREIHHMLTHASGAYIETVQVVRIKEGDGWQQFGSAITYARRYQVQCLLGVSAEFDDDGNAADGNTVAEHRDRSKAPTPKPAPKAPPKAKPEPVKEPELRTQPISDKPPAPDGEPCSEGTREKVRAHMRTLGIKGTEALAMFKSVIGKAPTDDPTEADGLALVAHLEKLAAADGVELT